MAGARLALSTLRLDSSGQSLRWCRLSELAERCIFSAVCWDRQVEAATLRRADWLYDQERIERCSDSEGRGMAPPQSTG
jgi:hypothetical protein